MNFSNRLRLLREEKSLTQDKLAKILNISRQSISSYENGTRFPNDIQLLTRLSKLFSVSIDYLIGISNIRFPAIYNCNDNSPSLNEDEKIDYSSKSEALAKLFCEIDNMSLEDIKKLIKWALILNGKL